MKPYTGDLSDSDVAGVYWSDLVNRVATGLALEAPARAAEANELVVRIREILEDRALIEGAPTKGQAHATG